jgi:replication fork protection complex subunit Tof1/Swi1
MHRQVVKAQAEGLYFTVSTLNLFRHILDDKSRLPFGDGTSDLYRLIQYVLRQFFKRLEADPFVMVEIFLPKSRGHWKALSSYVEEDKVNASERARVREQVSYEVEESLTLADGATRARVH